MQPLSRRPAGTAITLSRGGSVRSLRAVGATGFSGGNALVLIPDIDGTFAYTVTDVIGLGGVGTDITLGFGGYGLYAASSGAARIVNLTVSGGTFRGGNGTLISGYGASLFGAGLTANLAGASLIGPTNGAPGLVVSDGRHGRRDRDHRAGDVRRAVRRRDGEPAPQPHRGRLLRPQPSTSHPAPRRPT